MPAKLAEKHIDVDLTDTAKHSHKLRLNVAWLRDHCRCPSCYSPRTQQRIVDPLNLSEPGATEPTSAVVEGDKRAVVVHWADGHLSEYPFDWLLDVAPRDRDEPKNEKGLYAQLAKKRVLWNVKTLEKLPAVTYEEFMTPEGLKRLYENTIRYGVGTITGCTSTREATQAVIKRIGMPMESVYGPFWDISNEDREQQPDVIFPGSFTNKVLPTGFSHAVFQTHNDNAHYETPAGFRTYQIVEHIDGSGGESLIVDGFNVVDQLRKNDPEAFKFLSTTPVGFEKMMENRHVYNEQPMISLDPESDQVIGIRYKDPYRAPLSTISADQVPMFYHAYKAMTKLIRSPENEFRYLLPQGTVVIYDNWRVLHGRAPFTGKRTVHGALLQRDEFFSQARLAGAIV